MKTGQLTQGEDYLKELVVLLSLDEGKELVKICDYYTQNVKGKSKAKKLAKEIAEYLPCM